MCISSELFFLYGMKIIPKAILFIFNSQKIIGRHSYKITHINVEEKRRALCVGELFSRYTVVVAVGDIKGQ